MSNNITVTEIKRELTLDLTHISDVGDFILGKYEIKEKKEKKFLAVVRRPEWVVDLRLRIVEINGLQVRTRKNLLVISDGNQTGNEIRVTRTTPTCYFDVQLNPREILDIELNVEDSYTIAYKLEYRFITKHSSWFNLGKKEVLEDWKVCASSDLLMDETSQLPHKDYGVEKLRIKFTPISAEPLFEIKTGNINLCNYALEEEKMFKLTELAKQISVPRYNLNEPKILVGLLSIRHNQKLYASDPIKGCFDVCLFGDRLLRGYDLIELACNERIETYPYAGGRNGVNIVIDGADDVSDFVVEYDSYDVKYRFSGLYPKNEVLIPIYLHLRGLANPIDDFDSYKICINKEHQHNYNQYTPNLPNETIGMPIRQYSEEFKLYKNQDILDLGLFWVFPGEDTLEHSEYLDLSSVGKGGIVAPHDTYKIIANDEFSREYRLKIKNLSGNVDVGKIVVRDFRVDDLRCDDGIIFQDNGGRSLALMGDVFRVASNDVETNEEIKLQATQSCCISVDFIGNTIARMVERSGNDCVKTEVKLNFSFSYLKLESDEDDLYNGYQKVHGVVRFQFEMAPNPEWLCIDFGTSAVVAAFGSSIGRNNPIENILCDLHTMKANLLLAGVKHEERRNTNDEKGTKFISSTIALNPFPKAEWNQLKLQKEEGKINMNFYDESYVWFSPADGMIDYNYILPCLKSLMGHERLPENLFESSEILKDTELDKVDELYLVVYRQLLEYYRPIRVVARGGRYLQEKVSRQDIHKLIMSVPNTFAPIHLEKLKKLAHASFPNLRQDKLLFISESDAVAYNYINKRGSILKKYQLNADFDKRILVYDMGAGTLDLTYFMLNSDTQQSSVEVDICGKMGVSKSGNYMDYLIADIIADLMDENKFDEDQTKLYKELLLLYRSEDNQSSSSARIGLKKFVKEEIKHNLNNPEHSLGQFKLSGIETKLQTSYDGKPNHSINQIDLSKFKVQQILESEKFSVFLKEVSNKLFDCFAAQCGDEEGNLVVDMVIFSGRASMLNSIRSKVMDYFRGKNPNCRFLDIATLSFVEQHNQSHGVNTISGLKTAVVEGSLIYADRFYGNSSYKIKDKNVYATYGLMINAGAEGDDKWIPLIDSNTIPTGHVIRMGRNIYTYDSSKHSCNSNGKGLCIDIDNTYSIHIIQTYDSEHTLSDWRDGRCEMMTVLGKITRNELYGLHGNIPCRLEVTSDNAIRFLLGGRMITMLPHDDFGNESFRKSMWPIIWGK